MGNLGILMEDISTLGYSDMALLILGNSDIEFYNKKWVWTLGNVDDSNN